MTFTKFTKKKGKSDESDEDPKEEAGESKATEDAEDADETDTKNPKGSDVKKMVAAHGKCPDDKKPGYRKKVIGKARKAGAMQHIPDSWLKGKGD